MLEALCRYLEDEIERQGNVLAISRAQGEAARNHDIELLEARTAALAAQIREVVAAEKERLALVHCIVAAFELPYDRQTLSEVIAIAPPPLAERMREAQARLRAILHEIQEITQRNQQLMRRSLRVVNDAAASLMHSVPVLQSQYNARGEMPVAAAAPHAIDHRG
jgi:hypothetical protein